MEHSYEPGVHKSLGRMPQHASIMSYKGRGLDAWRDINTSMRWKYYRTVNEAVSSVNSGCHPAALDIAPGRTHVMRQIQTFFLHRLLFAFFYRVLYSSVARVLPNDPSAAIFNFCRILSIVRSQYAGNLGLGCVSFRTHIGPPASHTTL